MLILCSYFLTKVSSGMNKFMKLSSISSEIMCLWCMLIRLYFCKVSKWTLLCFTIFHHWFILKKYPLSVISSHVCLCLNMSLSQISNVNADNIFFVHIGSSYSRGKEKTLHWMVHTLRNPANSISKNSFYWPHGAKEA